VSKKSSTGRKRESRREQVLRNVFVGLAIAAGFSVLATIPILVGAIRSANVLSLLWVYPFYFAAGAAGGAIVGLLAPIQHRYLGRLLTAYLVVYLVYGGATVAFWPLLSADRGARGPSLVSMLGAWTVIALFVAPVYERISRSWRTA
jgi:hypothetical protein